MAFANTAGGAPLIGVEDKSRHVRSEALDFRAASESFAPVRALTRRDLETLRLVTEHQGRKVPTVGGTFRSASRSCGTG